MLNADRIRHLAAQADDEDVPPISAEQAEQLARLFASTRPSKHSERRSA